MLDLLNWENFQMFSKLNLAVFTSLYVLALSACGGGGGSSSSSTPPSGSTPAPSNAAPVATITVSNMSPNEGLISELDGAGSSDADGDTLTFSWTQLSGPSLTFSAPSEPITTVAIPNLTSDVTARIQLQVSDGTATTSREVTLNLTNLVLSPAADLSITREKSLSYPNTPIAIPTDFYINETLNFLVYENNGQFTWDSFGNDDADNLAIFREDRATSDSANIVSGLDVFGSFNPAFAALGSDKVTFLDPIFEPSDRFSIAAETPCSLVSGRYGPKNMVIGLRDGGAMLMELELDEDGVATGISTVLQRFGGNASLCAMNIDFLKLITFDQKTNTVTHYRINDDESGNITDIEEVSSITLDLDLPEGVTVDFVDSANNLFASNAMALVFSDGETEGNHRLVVVRNSLGGEFSQETYRWDYGVPTSIFAQGFERDAIESLVITTKDAPHAVIFKSGNLSDSRPYLPLSGPRYLDLGVGHGIISRFRTFINEREIIVSYPDQDLVKVLKVSP